MVCEFRRTCHFAQLVDTCDRLSVRTSPKCLVDQLLKSLHATRERAKQDRFFTPYGVLSKDDLEFMVQVDVVFVDLVADEDHPQFGLFFDFDKKFGADAPLFKRGKYSGIFDLSTCVRTAIDSEAIWDVAASKRYRCITRSLRRWIWKRRLSKWGKATQGMVKLPAQVSNPLQDRYWLISILRSHFPADIIAIIYKYAKHIRTNGQVKFLC